MRSAPKFWDKPGFLPLLLSPFSFFYARATAAKLARSGYRSAAKVICIGNITAGGAGKTPTAMAIAQLLQSEGKNVHFISKGYGRNSKNQGVVRVSKQKPDEVGDEPLLLREIAPTWVGDDRIELAKAAENAGADIIIMDDGLQNGELQKDISLIVIDGGYGFGNNHVIPAGPLREKVATAFKRADALIINGELKINLPQTQLPVFKSVMELEIPDIINDESVVAFCAIGRPGKFFESLKSRGIKLVEELAFPDHHYYNEQDFKAIFGIANSKKAVVVTTAKDMVKVPIRLRKIIYQIKAELEFEEADKLKSFILEKLA